MGLTYNKEYVPKDKRLASGGPRDKQMKYLKTSASNGVSDELVSELRNKIELLQLKIDNSTQSGYTDEQVNSMISEVVKQQTTILEGKIVLLEDTVKHLRNTVVDKEVIIDSLKFQLSNSNKLTVLIDDHNVVNADSRPSMDTVFVDPLEEKFDNIESFIDISISHSDDKQQMDSKVNKLKNLLGSKPKV